MPETEKPFACQSPGCLRTFTNEDHLSVHQEKHNLMLNLGMKNANLGGRFYHTLGTYSLSKEQFDNR